jgi:subtilisin family serine protease
MSFYKTTLTLFLLTASGFAQTVPGRYIVQLQGTASPSRRTEIRQQHAAAMQAARQKGAQVLDRTENVLNALMVRIPEAQAADLLSIPGVVRVFPVRMYQATMDHALPVHRVPDAWNESGGMANAGSGIKIGIIDTGIDSSHPAFQDSTLPVPAGYPRVNQESDKAYTNNKIIVARSYGAVYLPEVTSHDDIGHGTGVAMAAAGVRNVGPFGAIVGVAPRAYLGSYKVFPDSSGAPSDLVIKAIDDAVADGMDVINLSLGSVPAALPSNDPMAIAVENAFAAGVIVSIAAGNAGPGPNTICSPGSAPSAITVGSMSSDRVFSGSLRIGSADPIPAIPGNGPNSPQPLTAPIVDITPFDPSSQACGNLPPGSLQGSIALILRGICTFETKINVAAAAGAVAALIYALPDSPDAFNIATGGATLPTAMVSYPDAHALLQQLGNGPVTGTLDFTPAPITISAQRISGFSSQGPNLDGRIKPDLVVVGDPISTASPIQHDGSPNDGYVVESGTSFSSPIIAGAAALLKAARPGLTVGQYRSLIINSAAQFDIPAAIQQTGAGYLDMHAALNDNIAFSPTSLSFGTGSGPLQVAQALNLRNLGGSGDTYSLTVVPLKGSSAPTLSANTITVGTQESQTISLHWDASGLVPGSYEGYIEVRGLTSNVTLHIPYWYGAFSDSGVGIKILGTPDFGSR